MVLIKTMFIRSPRSLLQSKFIAFDQGTSGRPVSVLTCVKTNLFSDFLENEIFNFGSYRKFYAFILTSSLLTC